MYENYIADDCKFNPSIWAHEPDGTQCTTNGPERFHRTFNENFNSSHPNIFKVIEVLNLFQIETDSKILSIQKGKENYVRREAQEKLNHQYRLWMDYRNNKTSIKNYIVDMGNNFKYRK